MKLLRLLLAVASIAFAVGRACGGGHATGETPPSSALDRFSPTGTVSGPPPRFTFPEAAGVARYRITVRDKAGAEVAKVEGTASPLIFPEAIGRSLIRGETYRWELLYLDPMGAPTGIGPKTAFVVR
ncbi:MAG: hypothetical protein U0166_13165 [Acidobacteriota bacterium]